MSGPGSPGEEPGSSPGPGPVRALVAASAVVVALALAAGLRPGHHWLTELLVVAAMGQGVIAGRVWPRFWRGPAREAVFGAGGRFAGFLAAVAFSAVEAYAVGAGLGREEAPGPAVAILLAPPLAAAAFALRSAVRHRRENEGDPETGRREAGGVGGGARGEGGAPEGAVGTDAGRPAEDAPGHGADGSGRAEDRSLGSSEGARR